MEVPTHPHWRLAPHRENCIFPATACAVYPFASPTKQNTLLRQAVPFHGAESRRSEVNCYRNLSLQHQDHQPGEWQVSRCRCCLPKRRENHKRVGRHNPRLHQERRHRPFRNSAATQCSTRLQRAGNAMEQRGGNRKGGQFPTGKRVGSCPAHRVIQRGTVTACP